MNILYYSVHHILEYDELLMLRSLGHDVFRLGTRDRTTSTANWRPEVPNTEREEQLHDIYAALGGRYHKGISSDEVLPPTFIDHFSVSIIMDSADFTSAYWSKLSSKPVIWRTIGQNIEGHEITQRTYRDHGMKIIRYSPRELRAPNSLGGDAMIRFCKEPLDFQGWTGDGDKVLTFANTYSQRYPLEANAFRAIAAQLPCALGGACNETFEESFGAVSSEEQHRLFRQAPAYLYASGMDIPYTLNFIEAWMTGIPIVVYAPEGRRGTYFEVDALIEDGVTGFVCRSVEEVVNRCRHLLSDRGLAGRIGGAGRARAIAIFGQERIAAQWDAVLSIFN